MARLLVQLALAALARWEGTQHSTWLKYARNLLDTAQWQQGSGHVTRDTWPSPVHPVVDQGVHTRVRHRQPVEAEIHVADVVFPGD